MELQKVVQIYGLMALSKVVTSHLELMKVVQWDDQTASLLATIQMMAPLKVVTSHLEKMKVVQWNERLELPWL